MTQEKKKHLVGFQASPEKHQQVVRLAEATNCCRAEFLRRAIDVAEEHLEEIRAMGEPPPRKQWKH